MRYAIVPPPWLTGNQLALSVLRIYRIPSVSIQVASVPANLDSFVKNVFNSEIVLKIKPDESPEVPPPLIFLYLLES
jgi:hypothetical protein